MARKKLTARRGSWDPWRGKPAITDAEISDLTRKNIDYRAKDLPPAELDGPGHRAAREAAQAIADQIETERAQRPGRR